MWRLRRMQLRLRNVARPIHGVIARPALSYKHALTAEGRSNPPVGISLKKMDCRGPSWSVNGESLSTGLTMTILMVRCSIFQRLRVHS